MPASQALLRRVLLGLHTPANVRASIETAAEFASAIQSELLCFLVEEENLFNLAGLPFAQAIGFGGAVTPLTPEAVQDHFNRLARVAQQTLIEACTRANVPWQLERPQGETWRQLSEVIREGDVLVVNLQELQDAPAGLLSAARLILDTAAAIVLPPHVARTEGPVLAVSPTHKSEHALSMAKELSQAVGRKLEVIGLAAYRHARLQASVVVAPLAAVESIGENEFRRRTKSLPATTVLVAD
jgi:hypothetical protein